MTQALILDPWLEPLPSPGPAPLSDRNPVAGISPDQKTVDSSTESTMEGSGTLVQDSRSLPRMLVMNSDRFTLWKDHFERLKCVVEAWEPEGRRVLTLGE